MKMKFFCALSVAVVACAASFAQADNIRVWNKWCARKDTLLLFESGNNLIQVYCPTVKPADVTLKSLDKSLRIGKPDIKGDTLEVLAMPFPDKGKEMRLAILDKKTSKQMKVAAFVSDTIPQLVAKLGSISGAGAKKKDILAQNTMKVYFPKSLYSYPYGIKQFTFRISTAKGAAVIPVKGFYLTTPILKEINEAPEGTVIQFTDIKATCPDCAARDVGNISLKIK